MTFTDGISAHNFMSREVMLHVLSRVERGNPVLPFVWTFNGAPSKCGKMILEQCTEFPKGKAGEQGDAMMPLLFCLGHNQALQAIQGQLRDGEYLMAFLDDLCIVTLPDKVGARVRD